MDRIFTFEPAEFKVLEDIEFDETIQRPERVRFYTLAEQTTDAYEKLLPRGKVTRFKRDAIRKEVDRIQDLYRTYVIALPEEYRLREPEYGRSFSWIHPIYATDDRKEYKWGTSWEPLFDNLRQPGFYPRMIDALPRPFAETTDGQTYSFTEPTRFVNSMGEDVRIGLPPFLVTRTQRHEDKTIDVLRVPMDGSGDDVRISGYYLDARTLEVPNPFPDHPFLKGNTAQVINSTSPLRDIVPSMDAILTHGVPVTKDPYGAAEPYLKLYDVKLRDIPWSSWKSKFPPVDVVHDAVSGEPIAFPKPAQLAPPDNVIEAYKSSYSPGVSVRLWLMGQIDGGSLIPELLRSKAIDNGSVETRPGADLPTAAYPSTTIAECALIGTSFQDFMTKGVMRRTWNGTGDATLNCVPIEFIKQERGKIGYINRKTWNESTADDIKKAHVRRMEEVRPLASVPVKSASQSRTPGQKESQLHVEVMAVAEDHNRTAEDKVADIRKLLEAATLVKSIYSDADGAFVLCSHTIAILEGDLEHDRIAFYEKWAVRENGFRVCTACGQQINTDVTIDQAEFDEDGRLITRASAFEADTFHAGHIASFTTGLRELQGIFTDSAHDETVFLLLSLLQVLPILSQLEPLLVYGRNFAETQFNTSKLDETKREKFKGIVGIVTSALILQTHIPTLVPRRAFGSKPLVLTGFPRDSATPGDYTIVDTLLMVIQKTFEAFPTSFKGQSQYLIRGVLTESALIKKNTLAILSPKSAFVGSPLVKGLLNAAKTYHEEAPRVEAPKSILMNVAPPKELDVIRSFVACPSSRPIWWSGRYPQIVQQIVPLARGIQKTNRSPFIKPAVSVRAIPKDIPTEEIRKRLKANAPTKDPYVTNLLLTARLSDMFRMGVDVKSVNPDEKDTTLRDIGRGFLADTLVELNKTASTKRELAIAQSKDIALYTLQASYKSEKAAVNKLRASERIKFVEIMAGKSDQEREVMKDLLAIGLGSYIITNKYRKENALEAERLAEMVFREDAVLDSIDSDIGVGVPRVPNEDEVVGEIADQGEYGDMVADRVGDGHDPIQVDMLSI